MDLGAFRETTLAALAAYALDDGLPPLKLVDCIRDAYESTLGEDFEAFKHETAVAVLMHVYGDREVAEYQLELLSEKVSHIGLDNNFCKKRRKAGE